MSLPDLPIIDADLVGMRKILEHLINNAIKYTPDGGEIHVSASSWLGKPPNEEWPEDGIHIKIVDTGIGIEPGDLKLILRSSSRLARSISIQPARLIFAAVARVLG